jgi:glycosyltransferase involved in cell wall biosynthesis
MTHALHLTTWHPCIDGTAGTFVLEQCASLSASGLNIGVLFSRIEGLRSLRVDRFLSGLPGIVDRNGPFHEMGFKSWNLPGLTRHVRSINKLILVRLYERYRQRNGQPDILHAHVALETGAAARQLSEQIGVEYVVTEHSSQILNGQLRPNERAAAYDAYMNARTVIAVSQPLAERIHEIAPGANVKVIANLVRDNVYGLIQPVSKGQHSISIASISSLIDTKRIHQAIRAVADLPQELRNRLTYHIIGDGPERARLEAEAAKAELNVQFYGVQPHDAAMRVLAGADVFLHPSSQETFGIVLVEAMALGIPVIATRCGGPETIVSDETGVLVAVDDVPSLTDAIAHMAKDIDFWRERKSLISEHARSNYHEDVVTRKIAAEYA